MERQNQKDKVCILAQLLTSFVVRKKQLKLSEFQCLHYEMMDKVIFEKQMKCSM